MFTIEYICSLTNEKEQKLCLDIHLLHQIIVNLSTTITEHLRLLDEEYTQQRIILLRVFNNELKLRTDEMIEKIDILNSSDFN
jgi:hypothetical protein